MAETGGKTQEAPSQGVLEGEEAETKLTEVLYGGETSTELLQLEDEVSPPKGRLGEAEEVQEAGKEPEAARQGIGLG